MGARLSGFFSLRTPHKKKAPPKDEASNNQHQRHDTTDTRQRRRASHANDPGRTPANDAGGRDTNTHEDGETRHEAKRPRRARRHDHSNRAAARREAHRQTTHRHQRATPGTENTTANGPQPTRNTRNTPRNTKPTTTSPNRALATLPGYRRGARGLLPGFDRFSPCRRVRRVPGYNGKPCAGVSRLAN